MTVISGPPYPQLDPEVTLVRLPSLDLYEHGLRSIRPIQLLSRLERIEWFSKLTGGFAEPYTFGERVKRWFVDGNLSSISFTTTRRLLTEFLACSIVGCRW